MGFKTEAELCKAFISVVKARPNWTAYPETGGFDILIVRNDGLQIGIEAKLKASFKVVSQALPKSYQQFHGPDIRAVLIPGSVAQDGFDEVCRYVGITVFRCNIIDMSTAVGRQRHYNRQHDRHDHPTIEFWPKLPDPAVYSDHFFLQPIESRCPLPEIVPDVPAGAPAPLKLTEWKIGAIKLLLTLKERPVTLLDFKSHRVYAQRWTARDGYLDRIGVEKRWIAGERTPWHILEIHADATAQLRASIDKWMPIVADASKSVE